jgi:hypothetical protein
MSDNWLQFLPADPLFRSGLAAAERARALLATFVPRAAEARSEFKTSAEFFYAGANWLPNEVVYDRARGIMVNANDRLW